MVKSWTVPEPAGLAIEILGENAIVFYSLTGQTHLLNALAYEVLIIFQAGSESFSSLINKLHRIFEVEDRVDLELQTQKLITDFEKLGLIESTKCEN